MKQTMKKFVFNRPENSMTREEAGEYLGVSPYTVRFYEQKGLLKGFKQEGSGNITYYRSEDVRKLKKLKKNIRDNT